MSQKEVCLLPLNGNDGLGMWCVCLSFLVSVGGTVGFSRQCQNSACLVLCEVLLLQTKTPE